MANCMTLKVPDAIQFDDVLSWIALGHEQKLVEPQLLMHIEFDSDECLTWAVLQEAIDSEYLEPEALQAELGAFFVDELSRASLNNLLAADRKLLENASEGDGVSLLVLAFRLARAARLSDED